MSFSGGGEQCSRPIGECQREGGRGYKVTALDTDQNILGPLPGPAWVTAGFSHLVK